MSNSKLPLEIDDEEVNSDSYQALVLEFAYYIGFIADRTDCHCNIDKN